MIRVKENQLKRSVRLARVHHVLSSIDTPLCGYDWTEKGVRELASEITQKTGRAITFLFNKNTGQGDYQSIESKIFIAPTALLQQHDNYPIYGVFAKETFSKNLTYPFCLGEYQGALREITEETEGAEETEKSCLYTFDLGNGFELNAEHEGSWPRMINSASSEETANIYYERVNDKIYCYLKHPIQAGDQLLGYYGDAYEHENKRFLQPGDNWQTSLEYYQVHALLYTDVIRDGICYALPNITKLTCDTVNLPILERSNHSRLNKPFLPQWQQEKITLLHWACETGDIELLKSVRELHPDITIQSRISGHTVLHAVVLNQALSTEEKIEFFDVLLSNQPVRQLIATVLQDRDEQSVLHFAIAQEDVVLITYILTTELQKRNYKDGKDIRNCLNKQGLDFILSAFSTGSLPVLEAIKPHMTTDDLEAILLESKDVFCDIWYDLTRRYDHGMLCRIKAFWGDLFHDKLSETYQQLEACLTVTTKATQSVKSEQDLSVAFPLLMGRVLECSPNFSDAQMQAAAASLPVGAVLLCASDLSDRQLQIAAGALKTGRMLGVDSSLSDEQINVVAGSLAAGGIFLCSSRLSNRQRQVAVGALKAGSVFKVDSTLLNDEIKEVASLLGIGTGLLCSSAFADDQIRVAASSLAPGAVFFCLSDFSDAQIQLLSSSLSVGSILLCLSDLSERQIEIAAGSLAVGGIFLCSSNLSYTQLRIASGALKAGRMLSVDSAMSDGQIKMAAASLASGVTLVCSASLSENQIKMAIDALGVGCVFLGNPHFSDEQIQTAAGALRAGIIFSLDANFSDEKIQTAVSSLGSGSMLKFDPNISDHQMRLAVTSLGIGRGVLCTPDLSYAQIKLISFSLKINRMIKIDTGLSRHQVRIASASLGAGVALLCTSYYSDHQIQVASAALAVGAILLCTSGCSAHQIQLAAHALSLGGVLLCSPDFSDDHIRLAASALPSGTIFLCPPNFSDDQTRIASASLVGGAQLMHAAEFWAHQRRILEEKLANKTSLPMFGEKSKKRKYDARADAPQKRVHAPCLRMFEPVSDPASESMKEDESRTNTIHQR